MCKTLLAKAFGSFSWDGKKAFLDGWLPRAGLALSTLPYLANLARDVPAVAVAAGAYSLPMVGLLLLGTANLIYLAFRPEVTRLASNCYDYADFTLAHYTFNDIAEAEMRVFCAKEAFKERVVDARYDRSTFLELVSKMAHPRYRAKLIRQYGPALAELWPNSEGPVHAPLDETSSARENYRSLLISIARADYRLSVESRWFPLTLSLLFATLGYVFVIVPSVFRFFEAVPNLLHQLLG